jgi:CRP-like cAMP-binding protein
MDNLLLAHLPRAVRERIAPHLKPVSLQRREVLHRPGEVIRHVYFPVSCLISITLTTREGQTAEAGMAGFREMVGVNALMGAGEATHTEYIVQVAGDAVRAEAGPLREEFDRGGELRDVVLRHTQAMIAYLSQNSLCHQFHGLEQRLARWLLEARDRLGSDRLPLTHEFLSVMLGVRRAGVTESAVRLKEGGLISYKRGDIRILDGEGLEGVACECYRVLRHECDRLLGGWPWPGAPA